MIANKEQLLYTLIGVVLLMGGLIGYFLFSMMRQFNRHLAFQDGYDRAKLDAIEQERQLISADLHDDIGPILSATLYKLAEILPEKQREKDLLVESCMHVDSIYNRIRMLSKMLVPLSIERRGPFNALEEFAANYLEGQSLKLEIPAKPYTGLDAYHALHLFRMLQEILHNTHKHAKATRLTINASLKNGELFIETADDGIGFDPDAVNGRAGLGLQHLAIRARMIGARLQTRSWPGKGTRYSIRLPVKISI